ncbi:hypothetical protein KXD40_009153 [Peronospora effusa]|uniref:GAF domain-containing protein n=1 Tax=Peronospora effusa TaxID=542832 RepID=A0A3M6V7V4_9STRA|nr:hypothetical protein DD238_008513 [Peronospora effusa]RQM11449.1 hypothetical protein DD237_008545 [Peronospora effusa]UIZ25368.1 hypothetical protein KXD40_009153 [Peronospora effusa]
MLKRARAVHLAINFEALSPGPEMGSPWQRVEAVDQFVVFRRPSSADANGARVPGLDVMCEGILDASIEEVARVLRTRSEVDIASTMQGLYSKNFIFGSFDRDIPCSMKQPQQNEDDLDSDTSEQLSVKTMSFTRSNLFGRNEQWCFSDFFQRKKERDGFTISQRALPSMEPTPGRILGNDARVNQLYGLNASYLVDQLPNREGLRVVYNTWFESVSNMKLSTASSCSSGSSRKSGRLHSSGLNALSTSSSLSSIDNETPKKAQLRRLLSLARGITKLPQLIRHRRFGIQVPADLDAIQVANTRCPCCTHSLATVKLSLSMAASAIAKRSFRSLQIDTRRCYLCGYFVCINCWCAEYMESTNRRVAAIVVCTRCHACVQTCDYSEVCSSDNNINHLGPVKVVEDKPGDSAAPLLTSFLEASLMNASADGSDRAAILGVVRILLRESKANYINGDNFLYDEDRHSDRENQNDGATVERFGKFMSDMNQLPALESCVLASVERRNYLMELSDDRATMVPSSVISRHDTSRLKAATDKGLLLLAYQLAPLHPPGSFDKMCDVRDLDLLCQLALLATGCTDAFVTVMGVQHNHILAASNPGFQHTVIPREHAICQHTILTTRPFLVTHPEADVRFHKLESVKALSIRYYVGFPVTVRIIDETGESETEIAVGTLCCTDPTARAELTRSQYATMKRLSDTASRLIQLKGQQLLRQVDKE